MADEIKTTPTAYEIHKGDKVVSKDGRHGKIIEVVQSPPLCFNILILYEDDFKTVSVVDFRMATEKSLKDCCPNLYRINSIVFGNRLTAEEIQTDILNVIEARNEQLRAYTETIKRETDYLRKRAWRLKYQMPKPTYGTPINQNVDEKRRFGIDEKHMWTAQETEEVITGLRDTPWVELMTRDIDKSAKNIEQNDSEDKDE